MSFTRSRQHDSRVALAKTVWSKLASSAIRLYKQRSKAASNSSTLISAKMCIYSLCLRVYLFTCYILLVIYIYMCVHMKLMTPRATVNACNSLKILVRSICTALEGNAQRQINFTFKVLPGPIPNVATSTQSRDFKTQSDQFGMLEPRKA